MVINDNGIKLGAKYKFSNSKEEIIIYSSNKLFKALNQITELLRALQPIE